jgi:hypothetical protein
MRDENETEQLDQMLSEHFRQRLEPQCGRAVAAFEAAAAATATETRSSLMRFRRFATVALGAGGLIAAAVLVAWPLLRHRPGTHGTPKIVAMPISPIRTTTTAAAKDEPNVERLLLWRAVDEGASVVADSVPVRKLRYEAVEQVEWEDPVDQATIQLSVPVAEVVFVQQPTF